MRIISATDFSGSTSEKDRLVIANSILKAVRGFVPGDPPMGRRDIRLFFGSPMVMWDDEDHESEIYRIRVDSQENHWQQLAYQLAHELGHVLMGPARSNLLIEVFADMISVATVKRIGGLWKKNPPIKGLNYSKIIYSGSYPQVSADGAYRRVPARIRDEFLIASCERKIELLSTIKGDISKLALDSDDSRGWQHAASFLIREADQYRWKDLAGLAMNTTPSPIKDKVFSTSLPLLPSAIPSWVPAALR